MSVQTPEVYAYNIAKNICDYIAADDKKRLRKLLKANRLKLRKLYKDMSCNNQNILVFSASRNAQEVSSLLVKKLPKKILKENIAQVESISPEIANSIKERVK